MGVSIDQWRSAIGRFFSSGTFEYSSALITQNLLSSLLSTCLMLIVVLTLLFIGNVELNPGPNALLNCCSCNFVCSSAAKYSQHIGIHALDKNFQFRCPLCPFRSSGKRNLEVHLCRVHSSKESNPTEPLHLASSSSTQCQYPACEVSVSTAKELTAHLCDHIKKGETIQCPYGWCMSENKPKSWVVSFSKVQNFSSHVSKYHKNAPLPVSTEVPAYSVSSAVSTDYYSFDETPESEVGKSQENEETEQCTTEIFSVDDVCDYIAKFYLKLEADLMLPASTIQVISDNLTSIVNFSHSLVKKTLINEIMKCGVSKDDAERISYVSLADDPLYRVHSKNFGTVCLASSFLRYKYYKTHYNFEEPTRVNIVLTESSAEENVVKPKSIHVVPVRRSLANQLLDPQVQDDVDASLNKLSSGELSVPHDELKVYSDFTDGEVFRNHPASKQRCLYLNFFWDGFGTTNPLGSSKNIHKTIGIYYVLGNLPPEKRSRVDILQLSALFFESHFKTETLDVCLEPIINELKDLNENGIEYKGEKLPVFLLFMLGDNLGSHQIGGFVESFNSDYWCRYCDITKTQFLENPHLVKPNLRTCEEYEESAKKAKLEGLNNWMGVKFSSTLNKLNGFHVCLPALPPCLAHDLFEGVVAFDMILFIAYFIEQKWFTRQQLNEAIKSFQFAGVDASDKPSTIELSKKKLKEKLSGSAVKNWNMLRYFSLLVADYVVDVEDPVWQLYLKLKLICEYVCAPQISPEDVVAMDNLIRDYLVGRKGLFPTKRLKPKHHFMAHYAALTKKFGPLIRLFTLRMESNHFLLKRYARACNNFKDVTYTMTFKSQLRRAYLSVGNLFGDEFTFTVPRGFVPLVEASVRDFVNQLKLPASAVCVKSVRVNGTEYKCKMWLLIEREDNMLVVGEIVSIFCCTSVVFVVKKYSSTIQPNELGLHEICLADYRGLSHVTSLKMVESYYPLESYIKSGVYLTLKHRPLSREVV